MKTAWPLFIAFILLNHRFPSAYAAMEFKIDGIANNPTQINYDQTIEVIYSFSGVSPPKTYYLAGVFQKEAGSSYFGYTWNENWYKYGDEFINFYKLEIKDSSISGKLKLKPDPDSSGFKGTTDYQLKLFRYCTSSSACGDTNTLTIKIIAPASPSPAAAASPSPDSSGTSPVNPSPSASPISSPSPSPTPSASPRPYLADIKLLTSPSAEPVLGAATARPAKTVDWQLAALLLTVGTGLLLPVTIIIIRLWRKN